MEWFAVKKKTRLKNSACALYAMRTSRLQFLAVISGDYGVVFACLDILR